MANAFPRARFRSAGAAPEEIDRLQGAYERSDVSVQEAMLEHFKSVSTSGLREYLDNWRALDIPVVENPPAPEALERPLDADLTPSAFLGTEDTATASAGEDAPESDEPGEPELTDQP
jgi:hypothetical protein